MFAIRNIFVSVARQRFELICIAAYNEMKLVPVSWLLGFYVKQVVSRWWDQFMSLPKPDKFAMKFVNLISGSVSQEFTCEIALNICSIGLKTLF